MRKQELHPRTAVINKAQKNTSKKARNDALLWLAATFPAAFDNSLRIRPLKTGIMNDILLYANEAQAADISKSKLREAVVKFTRGLDYLACLKSREKRIDLQGNEVEEVTAEEAEQAATKIKKRIEKSVKNARKTLTDKISTFPSANQPKVSYSSKINNVNSSQSNDSFPIYPPRSSYSTTNTATSQARSAAVVVKHKTTKQYDPDAVARLKEKLGLSRSLDEKKDLIE